MKNIRKKLRLPEKNKFLSLLSNKMIFQVCAILIIAGVIYMNVFGKEVRAEDFGRKTILYSLIKDEAFNEVFEIIEGLEVPVAAERNDFINQNFYLSFKPSIQQPLEELIELEEQQDSTALAIGDSAIIKPDISETVITKRPRYNIIEYQVQGGDTISTIAQEFGISISTVLWANNLSVRDYIRPKNILKIPPVSGVIYQVKSGDNLNKIASTYDTTPEKIIEFNRLANSDSIAAGQELILPDGKVPAPIVQPKTTIAKIKDVFVPPASQQNASSGQMTWPTNGRRITQYFGWRHYGLDIDGDYTSPIYAAETGIIEFAKWYGGYGNCVQINHGNGVITRYGHLSKFYVSAGDQVAKGQTVGMMGTTGYSTGTHLHFEVRINGKTENPLNYIK